MISPVSLMRLTEVSNPEELLKTHDDNNIVVEEKLDGWKVQVIKTDDKIKLYSRRGDEKTENFPKIIDSLQFLPNNTLIEGELVYWEDNKQDVSKVISLAGSKPDNSLKKAKELPGEIKVHFYDILFLKGKDISDYSFSKRRDLLEQLIKTSNLVKITDTYQFNKWEDILKQAVEKGGEGVVFKLKDKPYVYKKLGESEPKPKNIMFKYKGGIGKSETDDFVVFAYDVSDKGNLKAEFGQYYKGKLYSISEIGNFSKENEKIIKERLKDGPFVVELGFQERLPGGLRHQRFIRFRDDKNLKDATMHKFHIDNIDNFKIINARKLSLLLKVGSYIGNLEKILLKMKNKRNIETPPLKRSFWGGVDLNLAYRIIAQVESNGKSHAIGDVGTSFGLTQVHAPYLLQMLSIDPEAQRHLGISNQTLKDMSSKWIKIKKELKTGDIWKKEPIEEQTVKDFIKRNPESVVKRMEGTTIIYNAHSIIKKRGNLYIKKTINWNFLQELGLNIYDASLRADVEHAIKNYITENVFRSSLAQAFVKEIYPRDFNKFKQTFSSQNIKQDGQAKKILDRASQRDFMKKVGVVIDALRKSNYDTTVPGALNVYQLIAIANASGPKVVKDFLLNGNRLSSGNLHYLIRANKYIQKETGISCSIPSNPSVGFKVASFKEVIKRASQNELFFPADYADSIKEGKRKMTIRAHNVPFETNDIIKAKTYSNAEICDLRILEKNIMSLTRIRKAFGNYIADELERKFGPDGRFVVLNFEPYLENMADEEEDDEKWDEILIDKDVKLTRQQIKDHYYKDNIRKKIMERIKDKPILIYIGVEKNKNILKRNHNDKPIVITNDDKTKINEPNNYFYWVDRRLLSIHEVFGKKTKLGFVDLDLHGDFPIEKAKKYAKELSSEIKNKYKVSPKIYESGGTGLHVEFIIKEKNIDELRKELKDLLDELNKDWENITTGIVKGYGIRSDISTLHKKGSLRVPGSLGENNGKEKKELAQNADDWSDSGMSDMEFGIRNINDEGNESGAITAMPPKQMFPIDGLGSYVASRRLNKVARRNNVEQEFIWAWDHKKHLLYIEKSAQDEKEIPGVEHNRLMESKGLRFVNDELNPRGFVTFYYDGKKEISTYEIPFNKMSWKVQMQVFEKFNLPMDGTVKLAILPAPRKYVKLQSLILVPRYGFNEEELLLSKKSILNYNIASTVKQAISEKGVVINVEPISQTNSSKYDCLIVVGGKGSKELSYNIEAQNFIKKFKYSVFIGKSLFLAAKANVLSDLIVTGDADVVGAIKRANAKWTGMPIERDGSVITVDGAQNIKNALLILSNIYDDNDEEMEGFSEFKFEEPEETEDAAAKWLREMEEKQNIKEKEEEEHGEEEEDEEEEYEEIEEEIEEKVEEKEPGVSSKPVSKEMGQLYKDLSKLFQTEEEDLLDLLQTKKEEKEIKEEDKSQKLHQSFEDFLSDVEKEDSEEEKELEKELEQIENKQKETLFEEEEEETEEEQVENKQKEILFEEEEEEIEEKTKEEEKDLLKDLTDEELQSLILSSEEIEEDILKDLTDEEIQELIISTEKKDEENILKDLTDEELQNLISAPQKKEKIETSVGKIDKDEFEELFGPIDKTEQNSEDVLEEKELKKRERAKTIFGPKLETIKDEDDLPLSGWPALDKMDVPKMSQEAADLFTIENISNDRKLSEIFNDPDMEAWSILQNEPHLLQSWILPGLIVAVGKKWFDNQKSRASIGSVFRRLGNTPFGLFDESDAETLKNNPELEIEDLPKAKEYIITINSLLPQLINLYFSNGYSAMPIGGWLKVALDREMKKIVAKKHDFKEKRVPRCVICKTNSPKNPNLGKMQEIIVDKKTLWYCPDCLQKAEDLEKNEIKEVSKKIKKANSELELINQKIQSYVIKIKDEEFLENENEDIIQQELKTQQIQKENILLLIDDLTNKKNQYVTEKEKYESQQNVPRWHTVCPNMSCPGQKVPLTSVDWKNSFWNDNKSIMQQMYDRFKIRHPDFSFSSVQEARDDEKKMDPRFVPPQWMLNVPFICPHDGKKFTLFEARKEAEEKGDWRDGVGFLTDPYFKLSWVPKGDASNKSISSMESSGELGKNNDINEELAYEELGGMARDIFLKKYWDKYNIIQSLKKEYGDQWNKALKKKGVMSVIREMSLYDSARTFSIEDQISYVAWLSARELSYIFSKEGKAVSKWATIRNTKISDDQISLPMLHKWVDDMLYSMGPNWQDGFEAFRLKDWLVNEKVEDIPSDGPGTFCFMQVNELMDLQEGDDKKDIPLGFKMEFIPAKLRGGLRSSANSARLLRVVGLWKVSTTQVSEIRNKIYKLKSYKNRIGLRETIPKMFVKDIISKENIVSQILNHDFNNVKLNLENTDLVNGDWVLVQSLIMPGQYKWQPLKTISQMREDMDDERIFKNFANLAVNNEDNYEFWRNFRHQVKNIKKELAGNEDLMKIKIKQLIEGQMLENKADDVLSEYNKKRNFDETSEPEGKIEKVNKHRFVIQNHHAKKAGQHWDLRLENDDGTMSSWSIPKHKLPKKSERIMAIKTEDHPLEYRKFEGEIDEGYGAGKVKIYDSGNYEIITWKKDKIEFKLKGKKEKGKYNLIHTNKNKWILTKSEENK